MRRTVTSRLILLATTVLAMIAFASPAWAATFTVDRGDDTNAPSGVAACTASANDCSLRGAIERSNPTGEADTINFAFTPGLMHTITLADPLTTGNDAADELTINGMGQDALTVRQGASVGWRVFQIVGKTTINGITISGGRSPNSAGGILNNDGAVLTLNDTTVTDNQALGTGANSGYGGGVYNASGAILTLNRSTVSLNRANTPTGAGGGIYNFGGTVTLNDSTVIHNSTSDQGAGGGIYNDDGIITIKRSTVSSNEATDGGGIYNNTGTVTLDRSTVSGNTATDGGGIYSDTALASAQKTTVTNSTISDNAAFARGGGVYNSYGRTVIEHSTITNNTAPSGTGSGVASFGGTNTSTEVLSSIISANTNTDADLVPGADNTFLSKGYNLIGTGNATATFNKSGDQRGITDPRLGTLANNGGPTATHAVLKASRAIDRGALRGCPATDQRGIKRPQNGDGKGKSRCDIGAFEKKTVR